MPARFAADPAQPAGDPLDMALHDVRPIEEGGQRRAPWHVRLGLGWGSGSPPVVLLLLVGMALGPHALAVLTPAALSAIDPALPVALAALGVQLGLTLPVPRRARVRPLLASALVESLVAAIPVTLGGLLLLAPDPLSPRASDWVIALTLGVCAAMSAPPPSDSSTATTSTAEVRQLDVLFSLVLGGILLACVREGSLVGGVALAVQEALLAVLVGLATWLLLARTSSETEERVFLASALLLLGGLADYLSLSALFGGLVAGVLWRFVGGRTLEAVRRGVGYVQHPLVVLMLVTAGAHTEVNSSALGLLVAYPVLRTTGKLAGAWVARRVVTPPLERDNGFALVAPGVFGIAFALNAVRATGVPSEYLLTVVVIGSMASQLAAFRALRRPRP
jgi:hypothetical protein